MMNHDKQAEVNHAMAQEDYSKVAYETKIGSDNSKVNADLKELLMQMRDEVVYSDKATMPVPLYEKIKSTLVATSQAENENLKAELERLRERLEIPQDASPDFPDGIECRNATIKLLEEDVTKLKAELKALQDKVVILPEGSEVEAGDIVCQECDEPDVRFIGRDHHEHRGYFMLARTVMKINNDPDEIHYKIIQRDDKPVVIQKVGE
jgi:hypothetical protein